MLSCPQIHKPSMLMDRALGEPMICITCQAHSNIELDVIGVGVPVQLLSSTYNPVSTSAILVLLDYN